MNPSEPKTEPRAMSKKMKGHKSGCKCVGCSAATRARGAKKAGIGGKKTKRAKSKTAKRAKTTNPGEPMTKKKKQGGGKKKAHGGGSKKTKKSKHHSKRKNPAGGVMGVFKMLGLALAGAAIVAGPQVFFMRYPQKKAIVVGTEIVVASLGGGLLALASPVIGGGVALTGLLVAGLSAGTPMLTDGGTKTAQGVLHEGRKMQGVLHEDRQTRIQGILKSGGIRAA
jgi:hypothetical protein